MSQLPDRELDQLAFILTGLGPKVSLKDMLCRTRGDVNFGLELVDWVWLPLGGRGAIVQFSKNLKP